MARHWVKALGQCWTKNKLLNKYVLCNGNTAWKFKHRHQNTFVSAANKKIKIHINKRLLIAGRIKIREQIDVAFLCGKEYVVCHFKKFLRLKITKSKFRFWLTMTKYIVLISYGQKQGTLAHAFFPGLGQICTDIHLGSENWTDRKTQHGHGKYNLFSVAVHEFGHALEMKGSNQRDSLMASLYRHDFSTENKKEILGTSVKVLIQKMYGKPETVVVRAVCNSKKAKVMIRKIAKNTKPENVKIVFTLSGDFSQRFLGHLGKQGTQGIL